MKLDREGGEAYTSKSKTILLGQNPYSHLWDWKMQIQAEFNGEVRLN
jgi:hypothetical protein